MKICFLAKSTIFDTENIFTCKNTFFLQLFLLPQELDLPSTGGIHCGFAWRCFPILGLELKFFGVDGGFPHSPGSTGSGHFFYSIVSRLGSCCKLVLWHHRWKIAWESDPPEWGQQCAHLESAPAEAWTHDLLEALAKHHWYVCSYVPMQKCMGPRPDSSQCVNILRHGADANPQSRMRIFGWQAMCIPMSLSPNSRVTVLSYRYRLALSLKLFFPASFSQWKYVSLQKV